MNPKQYLSCALALLLLASCNNDNGTERSDTHIDSIVTTETTESGGSEPRSIREESVQYTADGATMNGFIYYDSVSNDKMPGVLVVHEWWGLNDYAKARARQLAEAGYVAMAVDIYGGGRQASDPQQAMNLAMPFYKNPQSAAARLEAARQKLVSVHATDSSHVAAIGYCFGGTVVLNAARLGADLTGVASIHGDFPETGFQRGTWQSPVFIAHGSADAMVPMAKYDAFRKRLDSIGVAHTDKVYENATHAFSNPAATETGKKFKIPIAYNGAADTASWNDLRAFLRAHLDR
jgi:dienelactone hydrolase